MVLQGQHSEGQFKIIINNNNPQSHYSLYFLACDCFLPGTLNNGECLKNRTLIHEVGQCLCKDNVHGRQCDQCEDGFYGLRSLNGSCLSMFITFKSWFFVTEWNK